MSAHGRRLFIGAPLSTALAGELAAACESLARRAASQGVPIRWVAPASYHVTLAFLGWTRAEAIPAVVEAVARAARTVEPFRWKAARLGAFPTAARATVVWAGIDDPGGLARLAGSLADELAALGFRRETRPFHPHVTLGRLREPRDVADVLLPLSEQVFSATRCEFVQVMESVTKPSGSEYTPVARGVLRGAEGPPVRQSEAVQPASFDISSGTDDGWDRHS